MKKFLMIKRFYTLVVLLFALSTLCKAEALSDTTLIKKHLTALTKTNQFRTHDNVAQLNETADYIRSVLEQFADSVFIQEYEANGQIYRNVIGSFGTEYSKRIVVGAHYDVCGPQEGADDNASGVVGLLELARLLQGRQLSNRIDLVAYTLEEPPYFRTDLMGSYIHAKSLADSGAEVYGMVSLEMIGYFQDHKKSQSYPIGLLSLFYGNRGNYITLVNKFGAGKFARDFGSKFKATKAIRTKTFTGPPALPGIDFSDHQNYWKFGYSALMLTDTAFYRNKNYHQPTDTLETLDLERMAKVIEGVYSALIKL
jgi:Zn-dependent M28 family amino/carboxypeptidase